MKTFLILLFTVAAASAAKTHTKRATYTASINDYVDLVVMQLQSYITDNGLDSLSLPNVTQSFSVKPLLITYSGRLSLFDGELDNLASLRRFGDVDLTYADKVLSFAANVGVDKLNVAYRYQSKLIGITANGYAHGTINTVGISASLSADFDTYNLALNNFAINEVGDTTVTLSGNSITDWFANAIISVIGSYIKNDVISTINSKATEGIESSLDNVNEWLDSTRA